MKTLLQKLFTSPNNKGFWDSPFIYLAGGVALMLYALTGLFSGEIDVGRYGSSTVVRYATAPGWFLFTVAALFGLGAAMAWWGRRLLRMNGDARP
jgi:hypothetical protein